MNTIYETDIELKPEMIEMVNFYKDYLPKYTKQSELNYVHSLYINKCNLKVTYFYGHGCLYKISIKHIEYNS